MVLLTGLWMLKVKLKRKKQSGVVAVMKGMTSGCTVYEVNTR